MDRFEERFSRKKAGQETVPSTDAEATQATEEQSNEQEDLLPKEQGELQPETSEVQSEEVHEEQHEKQVTSTEETVDYKAEYEKAEKRRRDLQSHFDSQLNELKKEMLSIKQSPQPEPVKQPEINKDEFNDQFFDDPFGALQKFAQQFAGQVQQPQLSQQEITWKIQEEALRSIHPDFDEVIAIVQKAAPTNPDILEKIQQAPNQTKEAYEQGKKLLKAYKIQQDPEAYEKELRKKWEEEQQTENHESRGLRKVPHTAPTPKNQNVAGKNDAFDARFDRRNKGSRRAL